MATSWLRRAAPAIGLFFLAPLVAEFLLGDLPINLLGVLVILAPLYGGGALLVREFARRRRLGWPGIFVLALAYAIVEEAFTTQTLFNPNYLHLNLHLLDPAYIPALGIGAWWTVFVLSLHTVWSISCSIALMEALVPDRAESSWLGPVGLSVTAILFVLAAIASTANEIRQDHFIASRTQFTISALICIILIATAFLLPRRTINQTVGWVPNPWLVGTAALAAGSIFLVVPKAWAWGAVGLYLVLDLAIITLVYIGSHHVGWNGRHRLALAAGAALAYAWHAFIQTPAVGAAGKTDRIGNVIFAAALLVFLFFAARNTASRSPQTSTDEKAFV
jgi:hypothetical protein